MKTISKHNAGGVEIHKDLIEKSKKGNPGAQYKLYQLYAKAMLNVSYRMMHNREEAEDMLQESFTDAFLNLHTFRHESSFGSWLKRIVVNKCLNEINRRKADLKFFDDMIHFEDKHDDEPEDDGSRLNVNDVKNAMGKLPNGARMIFSLYLLEGYDHQEISEILNISVSNSKSQYMRAKRRVREVLNTMDYER